MANLFTESIYFVGPKGAETLGYVIRKPTCKLKVLNLRLNEIGDDGGQYLITALVRDAVNLKSLIISGCGLTKKTENLGKMIAFNNTLETLDISNNRLEEVRQNFSIQEIENIFLNHQILLLFFFFS